MAGAVVGKGFRFGYKQSGDAELLKTLGERAGLRVHVSDLVGAASPGVVGTASLSLRSNSLRLQTAIPVRCKNC